MSKTNPTTNEKNSASSLDFDPDSLTQGIRVNQVTFAKMMGVSKQAVSGWIKEGKIRLQLDGKIDPEKAAQEVINNTHPGRIRAKLLKAPANETAELKAELRRALDKIQVLETIVDEYGLWEEILKNKMLHLNSWLLADLANDEVAFNQALDRIMDDALMIAGWYLGNVSVNEDALDANQIECLEYLQSMARFEEDEEGEGELD